MQIILHLIGLLSTFTVTLGVVAIYGRKPTRQRLALGFALATLFGLVLLLFVVLNVEGNNDQSFLYLWICAFLIGSFIPNTKKAAMGCVILFCAFAILRLQHMSLSMSPDYTDSPEGRQHRIARTNKMRQKRGEPPVPSVKTHALFHTWLTGLYKVEKLPIQMAPPLKKVEDGPSSV